MKQDKIINHYQNIEKKPDIIKEYPLMNKIDIFITFLLSIKQFYQYGYDLYTFKTELLHTLHNDDDDDDQNQPAKIQEEIEEEEEEDEDVKKKKKKKKKKKSQKDDDKNKIKQIQHNELVVTMYSLLYHQDEMNIKEILEEYNQYHQDVNYLKYFCIIIENELNKKYVNQQVEQAVLNYLQQQCKTLNQTNLFSLYSKESIAMFYYIQAKLISKVLKTNHYQLVNNVSYHCLPSFYENISVYAHIDTVTNLIAQQKSKEAAEQEKAEQR